MMLRKEDFYQNALAVFVLVYNKISIFFSNIYLFLTKFHLMTIIIKHLLYFKDLSIVIAIRAVDIHELDLKIVYLIGRRRLNV
jgi:hypothetical protein